MFRLRDHTADVAVEATAPGLPGAFAAVADGLAAAACDDIPDPGSDTAGFEITVRAERREALLFDYLDQLIYERDVRGVLPVRNEVRIEPPDGANNANQADTEALDPDGDGAEPTWRLEATYRGLPLDDVDAKEIKAVTYSEMRVERTDGGWRAYVVFDV